MPEINLPGKIIFERNALNKFRPDAYERAIIISDSDIVANRSITDLIKNKSTKIISHVSVVVNTNIHELYRLASEEFFRKEAELIVAIGSGAAIDCGMLLSHEGGTKFTAIPCSCACSMTDFENSEYYSYRHSPDEVILDPSLIECMPSAAVAYDAMASFAYAIDTLSSNDNIIAKSLAINGAVGVYKNIIPAYRGEISALERLLYSMYICVVAHRNGADLQNSYLSRVSKFFSDFGYSKSSVCALTVPNIIEYEESRLRDGLFEIAKATGLSKVNDDPSFASIKLIDETRKIQASMGIPRAVSGFNLSENAYHARKIHSNIPDDLLDLCYYGSFKFMKL